MLRLRRERVASWDPSRMLEIFVTVLKYVAKKRNALFFKFFKCFQRNYYFVAISSDENLIICYLRLTFTHLIG